MVAWFSAPDAGIVVAVIAALAGWWNTRQSHKQMKPNGGASLRDAVDRIEERQKTMVADVRDLKADVRGVKADVRDGHARILALEAVRDPTSRERSTDVPFDWAHWTVDLGDPPAGDDAPELDDDAPEIPDDGPADDVTSDP